jgi:hypothetical protein
MNLSNGNSSASVVHQLTLHTWTLNCTALTRSTEHGQSSYIACRPTENASCNTSSIVAWCHRTCIGYGRYIATAVRVTYRDSSSIVACGHYLGAGVSLPPQFLLCAYMPQYDTCHTQWCLALFPLRSKEAGNIPLLGCTIYTNDNR